jgi:molybdopterin-synthase adenylyltransferase
VTEEQVQRYARHILLPDVGGVGQRKLLGATVRLPSVTGADAVALLYLAAAGVGTIVVDDEGGVVESADLPWGLFEAEDLGQPRLAAARLRVAALNPDVTLQDGQRSAGPGGGTLEDGAARAAGLIRALL